MSDIQKVNIEVILKEDEGTFVVSDDGDADLTLKGLLHLNQLIGASIFLPDKVFVDGDMRENPYIIRETDGSIKQVTATAVAVSACNGKEVTTSATVCVNIDMLFINQLMSIVANDETAGSIVKKGSVTEDDSTLIYSVNSKMDLVVNINNIDIIKAIEEYTKQKTFGERLAISQAQRNALKKIPQFNCGISNPIGNIGERFCSIKIPFYYNSDKDINSIVALAKSINGNVLNCKLINVDTQSVIDYSDMTAYKSIDRLTFDEDIYKKERASLIDFYKSLDKDLVFKNLRFLYPNVKSMKELNNAEIKALLKYTQTIQK